VTKLILASTSPARKKLMLEAGLNFQTTSPGVDEDALVFQMNPSTPKDLTQLLATAKARAVAKDHPESLVIGCDSALWFDGEILGKPLESAVAIARWKKMSGQSGELFSGHCVIDTKTSQVSQRVTSTKVFFAELTDQQIERYVSTNEPLEVAGAFTIDGMGGAFIERIEGDYHTVVGLSLVALRKMIEELGHNYQDFWR
jgi:septum formation protein